MSEQRFEGYCDECCRLAKPCSRCRSLIAREMPSWPKVVLLSLGALILAAILDVMTSLPGVDLSLFSRPTLGL